MASDGSEDGVWQSTDRQNLNKSMDTLFPQQAPDKCRVCNEAVVDGRWNYCSERCREIANAVQGKFLWDTVREKVRKRDDHTCQNCGISKDRWWRAYWQCRELSDEGRLREDFPVSAPTGAFHVDHITPISQGGHPFDESNLQTLCKHCHRAKTAEENSVDEPEDRPEIGLEEYFEE